MKMKPAAGSLNRALLCLTLLLGLPLAAPAQDTLEMSRENPPQHLTAGAKELALQTIAWKLLLNRDLQQRLERRQQEREQQLEASEREVSKLAERLPPEMRFMDAGARSRLASRLSESLLDARLELAAQEKMLELLQAQADQVPAEGPVNRRSQSLVKAAEINLTHAQEKLKATRRMQEKGLVSEAQLRQDEQEMQLAEAELENAVYQATAEAQQPVAELARQITDLRLAIEPIRARMRAAENYLESLTQSAAVVYQIELRQRQQQRWQATLGQIAEQLENLRQEVDSLQSLQARIEESVAATDTDQ